MSTIPERLSAALADRYRIERELGQGGMATVYLAEDLRHDRRVALKVLRPELTAVLGAERFLREIRIAARFNHPHILALHDSGEADGFLYYVMPVVEGESLRVRLDREGRLPIEDAAELTRQVASALDYAHRHGVVHRDIKPENILLHEGVAVVTDFGIAIAVDEAGGARLTKTGFTAGTPLYMSPEQAVGEQALDARSDVYALGCVLFEMLTGQPPLAAEDALAMVTRRITEAPPDVPALRPDVPADLNSAVRKALSPLPADRHASAAAFAAALAPSRIASGAPSPWSSPVAAMGLFGVGSLLVLGAVYVVMIQLGLPDWVLSAAIGLVIIGLPVVVTTAAAERRRSEGPHRQSAARWLTWRRVGRAGALAVTGLALVTASYMGLRVFGIGFAGTLMAKGVLDTRDPILLADFTNRTADSTIAQAITEGLRIDLMQSRVVRLVERAAIQAALRRMRVDANAPLDETLALQLAEREGIKAVLVGEVRPVGRGYLLSVRLIAPPDGAALAGERVTAEDDTKLIPAIDRLSARLRGRIGESLRDVRASPRLERVTTTSVAALRKYTQGVGTAGLADGQRAGIRLLEEAVALDSTFAMAYRALSVILDRVGRTEASTIALTRAWQLRDRLPDLERHLVTALYHNVWEYDPGEVENAYHAAIEIDPDSWIALTNLAAHHGRSRRWAVRESLALRSLAAGGGFIAWLNVLNAQLLQGKFAEAEALVRNAPGGPSANSLFDVETARRDYDAAERVLREDSTRADARRRATLLWLRGRMKEADQVLTRYVAQIPPGVRAQFESLYSLAIMHADLGAVTHAIEIMDRFPADALPPLERVYPERAEFHAGIGQLDRARALIAEFERSVPPGVLRHPDTRQALLRVSGEVALGEGRFADAVRDFAMVNDLSGQCTTCGLARLAQAWLRSGRPDSALAVYERMVSTQTAGLHNEDARWLPHAYRQLGELYDADNDIPNAIRHYGTFVELWRDADPELQPRVDEVRQRLAALVARRG